MSFDSLTLHLLVHEFRDTLLNGTIRHVEQLNPHSITLKISQETEIYYLLISAHPVHARTHLIKRPPKGQARSHFADFLMKHTLRGKITAIEQIGWERMLKLSIEPVTDIIETPPRAIIAEFMGKHSNIILIDESTGNILESIKHIDETMSRHREVLPGVTYIPPPPQDKLDPLTLEREAFVSLVESQTTLDWRTLFDRIDGLSPTLAKEIIHRAYDNPTLDGVWEAYQQVAVHFNPAHSMPQILVDVKDKNKVIAVSALELHQFPHTARRTFETMSQALSDYYDAIARAEAIQSERNALNQVIDKLRAAIDRKLVSLRRDLANAEQAEDYRIKGELLTANLHRVERGQTVIEVQNYYSPELSSLQIELDPQIRPPENAQQYFKKYTKAKRGRTIIVQLIADNETEREVLDYHALEVEEAKTLEELQASRSEFVKKGWIREGRPEQKKQQPTAGAFRKYTSPDGFQIYIGRNSKENDLLLRRIASGRDMWLHAKQIHGSHVIIRNPENKPGIPMPTLLQAAQIAAFFSKARHSSHVPVDYTWARYVVKPKGGAAGFVNYTHEKTLYVEPEGPNTHLRSIK